MSDPSSTQVHVRRGLSRRAVLWIGAGALTAAAAIVLLCIVVVLMLLGTKQLADQQAACAPSVDPATVSMDVPGSLGGMYGTGITRAEYNTVKAAARGANRLTPGVYRATQYGPPWGGIEGDGVATSAGLPINGGAPQKYFIAVDPSVISYGQWVYVWPNQFGWPGPFLAADTGGAIRGGHVDVYDWRGTFTTLEHVRVSARPIAPGAGDVAPRVVPVAYTPMRAATASVTENATAGGFDAAVAAARRVAGSPVGFALVDATGRVVASYHAGAANRSASVTKAMVLVAVTQMAAHRDLTAVERRDVQAMIRRSDNAAANRLFAQAGAQRVRAVARAAGMAGFALVERKRRPDGYVLGFSQVTAADLARLFARIDVLLAPRHRGFALAQLEQVQGAGRFGVYDAGATGPIRSKSGWRPEDDGGWTVNQAAQLTIDGATYGLAVVLGKQPSFAAGAATVRTIAAAVISATPTAAVVTGGDCGQRVVAGGAVGERIAQIADSYLGRSGRVDSFRGFVPPRFQDAWCAWFATNVWRLAGVPIPVSAWSGAPYDWAKARGQLFKTLGTPPHGSAPPLGSAVMYGAGPQAGASDHVNLVTRVNPDATLMLTGGNQGAYPGHVTQEGPCRLVVADPARLIGPGCDPRPIYAIAAPTAISGAL